MRFAWYAWPSLALGAIFWGAVLFVIVGWSKFLHKRAIPRHCIGIAGIGAVLNAVVVLANGGYMPVHGMSTDVEGGIWRSTEHGGNLLFLADRMSWGGASPGDFFLAVGIIVGLSLAIFKAVRATSRRLRPAAGLHS
jgi:hypothetical protein